MHRVFLIFLALATFHAAAGEVAAFRKGVVATVHPVATDAAVEMMKSGGNAIDAAVMVWNNLTYCLVWCVPALKESGHGRASRVRKTMKRQRGGVAAARCSRR